MTSQPLEPVSYPFERRDEIRLRLSEPFLRPGMIGAEIGGGAFPSRLPEGVRCEHFDKRAAAGLAAYFDGAEVPEARPIHEMPARFPEGCDFLIAHNVLEHAADPVGTLVSWLSYVRRDGIVIVSFPHRRFCPGDARRPQASLEHLLLDYAFREHEFSLEAREHFIAGCVGWAESWPEATKNEFAVGVLEASRGSELEHHFHVFDEALAAGVVRSAAHFFGAGRILLLAGPCVEPKTDGDIIVLLGLNEPPAPVPELDSVSAMLRSALQRLA